MVIKFQMVAKSTLDMDDEMIFGTLIVYVVSITMKVPDQCYELGV